MKQQTDVAAEVDEQTKDELRPPCDVLLAVTHDHCPSAAQWVVWSRCPSHGDRAAKLDCDVHMRRLSEGRMACRPCLPAHVYLTATRIEAL